MVVVVVMVMVVVAQIVSVDWPVVASGEHRCTRGSVGWSAVG